jgi:anti-sigma regulatory factor (Ser/Thr protein kinase)
VRQFRIAVIEQSQVGEARRTALHLGKESGFKEPELGRIALLATELAANLAKHANHGELLMRVDHGAAKQSFEFLALDRGPGMRDVVRCMEDGYSTAGSPGTGLGSIARVGDQFDIYSDLKHGTAAVARIGPDAHAISLGLVHQAISGESISGDACLTKQLSGGLTLCVLADGVGHGLMAAVAATAVIGSIERDLSVRNPGEWLAIAHEAAKSTRGAAVGIAILDMHLQEVRFAGVGNISAVILDQGTCHEFTTYDGVLGLRYWKAKEFSHRWSGQCVLVLHSDGIRTRWDINQYPGLLAKHPSVIAGVLYRDFARANDDVTVLAISALHAHKSQKEYLRRHRPFTM